MAVIGPDLKILLMLYTEDRKDGCGRYRAFLRLCDGYRSMIVGRLRYR